jgi:hypothetical protein
MGRRDMFFLEKQRSFCLNSHLIKLMVALTEKHFHEIFKVKNSNNPFKIGVIEML